MTVTILRDGTDMDREPARTVGMMVLKIACIVFTLEALIMVALSGGDLSPKAIREGLLDSTSLTLLSCPLIYYWVARPFADAARAARVELTKRLIESDELLKQNERLRYSLQKVSESAAETNERILQKIGADLHDGPAQLLSFVLLRLDTLERVVDPSAQRKGLDNLDRVRSAITDTLREVRGISSGLSLPELDHTTLHSAVKLAIQRHEEVTGTKVELKIFDDAGSTSLAQKTCAYRFVQEALANAFKHAHAKTVGVTVSGTRELRISVDDDGCGFNCDVRPDSALGLTGMEARIQALGGRVKILSGVGSGTTVIATMNLDTSS
jgi:signal transduction histidine kinase